MNDILPALDQLLGRPDSNRRLGPFRLVEQLGRGGFAPVWLAREAYGDQVLRTAAVKLFSVGEDVGEQRSVIIEEARALSRVEHPNVVRFYSLFIDEEHGVMGLVMEHLAGATVGERLERHGRLALNDALDVGISMASALSAVHRAGLVHRDVKPSNVMHVGGVYKLIDFGIASVDAGSPRDESGVTETRLAADDDATQTFAGIGGTRGYVDPECIRDGATATASSDLYSLGATLFECLSGRLPGTAADGDGLRPDVLDGTARPSRVDDLIDDIPEALGILLASLLEPRRADRPSSAEFVAAELGRIREEQRGDERVLPPEDVGPFRGLGRFEQGDRDVYFGRSSEIAAALETLRGRGIVALIGPSGSGKSSLARAGVLPAVLRGGLGPWPRKWQAAVVTPGPDPRTVVAEALTACAPHAGRQPASTVVSILADHAQRHEEGTLLLVDQFEEIATRAEGESRTWTVELLREIAERTLPGVRAIVTARRDLLGSLLSDGELGQALLRGAVLVGPVHAATWRDIVEQALDAYGYSLEDDDLADELFDELGTTADAMPLVQFALTELWQQRDRERKLLTRESLRAIGGIAGALERHADRTLDSIAQGVPRAEDDARDLLLAMTTAEGTRSVLSADAVRGPGAQRALKALVDARLVQSTPDGVTLTHESLLEQWGRHATGGAEATAHRLLLEELDRDAARWKADPHAPLWKRRRLVVARELEQRGRELPEDARAFLRASRRAELQGRLVVGIAAGAALLVAVGAGVAYVRAVQVEQEKTEQALAHEQESRRVAEQRTLEVAAAQKRIDALLEELADSPGKERVKELQAQIRQAEAAVERAAPMRTAGAPRQLRGETSPAPGPAETASQPRKLLEVEEEW